MLVISGKSYLKGVELAAYQSSTFPILISVILKKKLSQTFTVTSISMAFTLLPHLYLNRIHLVNYTVIHDQQWSM